MSGNMDLYVSGNSELVWGIKAVYGNKEKVIGVNVFMEMEPLHPRIPGSTTQVGECVCNSRLFLTQLIYFTFGEVLTLIMFSI